MTVKGYIYIYTLHKDDTDVVGAWITNMSGNHLMPFQASLIFTKKTIYFPDATVHWIQRIYTKISKHGLKVPIYNNMTTFQKTFELLRYDYFIKHSVITNFTSLFSANICFAPREPLRQSS